MELEEFAAKRDGRLATFDKELRPIVERHLGSWSDIVEAASVLWLETFEEVSPSSTSVAILRRFQNELLATLKRTKVTGEAAQIDRITMWLGTYAINDATYYGARSNGFAQKRWVTVGDADVRAAHRGAAGQTVGIGDSFTVDGVKMRYPGEPVGSPALWLNCRCYVQHGGTGRSASMTAFESAAEPVDIPVLEEADGETFEERTGVVIVALPAEGDDVAAASSEDIAHMTLVWLGDASADAGSVGIEALQSAVAEWAAKIDGPITEKVAGSATLGDDKASVVLVDAAAFVDIRNGMTADGSGPIGDVAGHVTQFPVWTPHVTLGYPETPPVSEYVGTEITFDRLALWVGDDRTEYPMGQNLTAAAAVAPIDEGDPELLRGDADGDDLPPTLEEVEELEEMGSDPIPFHGVAAPMGIASGDKRMFAEGPSLTWRSLPFPILYQDQTTADPHGGAVRVGTFTKFEYVERDGKLLLEYSGLFASPEAEPLVDKVVQGIAEGWIRGISVDLDLMKVQAPEGEDLIETAEQAADFLENYVTVVESGRVAAGTLVAIPAFEEAYIALGPCDCPDEQGVDPDDEAAEPEPEPTEEDIALVAAGLLEYLREDAELAAIIDGETAAPEAQLAVVASGGTFAPGTKDGPGWITHPKATSRIRRYWVSGKGASKIRWGVPGDFNRCRSNLGKYVPNPSWLAGLCANMHKEATGVWPGQDSGRRGRRGLVAAGADLKVDPAFNLVAAGGYTPAEELPERSWFDDPQLDGPTPFTVTPEGRVYGHVATWGVCHIGVQGACTTAPHSRTGYAYYRTGMLETNNGDVAVGQITMDTGHADLFATAGPALAHYDNTGSAVADVSAGEDAHGIWVAGSLRPDVDARRVRKLKAAALSGDWRRMPNGGQEMVAALAVNTPGFPIPRMGLAASAGAQNALVAAGIVEHHEEHDPALVAAITSQVEARFARRARREAAIAAVRPIRIQNAKKGS